eukprot:g7832.t1
MSASRNWREVCDKYVKQSEAQPNNPIPLVNCAYANLQRQLYRKALKNVEKAISVDSTCLKAYLLGSKILLSLKKKKKALKMIENGLAIAKTLDDTIVYFDVIIEMEDMYEHISAKKLKNIQNNIKTLSATAPPLPGSNTASTTAARNHQVEPISSKNNSKMKITLQNDNDTKKLIASSNVTKQHIEAASKHLTNKTGVKEIDEAIALAYLKVNTGKYNEAIEIFDHILKISPNVYPALLGRGSAYALTANFNGAIKDLSKAVQINASDPDGYKRLGQVLGAVGHVNEAAAALRTAQRLNPDDYDSFQQCATIYHKNRNYRQAIIYFQETINVYTNVHKIRAIPETNAKNTSDTGATMKKHYSNLSVYWNYVGLCENAVGSNLVAVKAYQNALKYDSNFKEAIVNMGQAYRDYGMASEAAAQFTNALKMDSNYIHAHHLKGLLYHAEGKLEEALQDFLNGLIFDPKHVECRVMVGIVLHGMGRLTEAIKHYTVLIDDEDPENVDDVQLDSNEFDDGSKSSGIEEGGQSISRVAKFGSPSIWAWYQREMASYLQTILDVKFINFHFTRCLHPLFKEMLTKRQPPKQLLQKHVKYEKMYRDVSNANITTDLDVVYKKKMEYFDDDINQIKEELSTLLPYVLHYGKLIQLKSPGFLSNLRQHRQCGYAILEMAQTIRREWSQAEPTIVTGKYSSSDQFNKKHAFGWREFFDIGVKWRQFSEPNDPVFWIDYMTKHSFEEGFGLQTPMITGQLHVPRYYPYFKKAFKAIKGLIDQQCPLTDELRENIYNAKTGLELYKLMGRDFWVVSPCYRLTDPTAYLEGTRLTMVYKQPDGIEFTTRMPGLPGRYKEYGIEMEYVFNKLKIAINKGKKQMENKNRRRSKENEKEIGNLILTIFYLWVTFAPLTRGSAATGYAALYALFLAADMPIQNGPPCGVQADFEAFLEPKVDIFIEVIRKKWLDKDGVIVDRNSADKDCNIIEWSKVPNVSDVITTPRQLIEALNVESL